MHGFGTRRLGEQHDDTDATLLFDRLDEFERTIPCF